MSLINLIKDGLKYMDICIDDRGAISTFPEIKVIKTLKYAKQYLPPVLAALCLFQYFMRADIIMSVITILFALSLPIQGILWLGKRANSPLPLTLLNSYNDLKLNLIKKNILSINDNRINKKVDFMALMVLYDLAKHGHTENQENNKER